MARRLAPAVLLVGLLLLASPAAGDNSGKIAELHAKIVAAQRHEAALNAQIAGVTTEVCVQTTMREANDRGYECLLLEDCTESYFPEFKRATLAMVRAQGGIVGWTATSAQVLAALDQ